MQKTKTLHLQTGCCNIQYFISVFVDKCLINLWFLPFYYMDNAERHFPVALLWMCGYLMPAPGVRKCYLKSLSFFFWGRLTKYLLHMHTLFTCTLLYCAPQILHFLQIEGLCQVSQCHFSEGLCSRHVSELPSIWDNSQTISSIFIIICAVVTCDQSDLLCYYYD